MKELLSVQIFLWSGVFFSAFHLPWASDFEAKSDVTLNLTLFHLYKSEIQYGRLRKSRSCACALGIRTAQEEI